IDILNIGLALARQHVGALRYERKVRPYQQAILLKVPPFEVPIEVALAIVEDNAASSMLVAAKRVLRKSRCQVAEAVAPDNIGSEIERDSEYCCMRPVEPTGRAYLDLIPRIMEDGVPEVLLDALKEHYRRARASHGWQDHGYRRTGVRIDPTGNYLRWPAQSLNEIQQLPVVAKTVDLEPHSREPVFDAPAILAERVNFDRAMRMQHREQILHRIGQRLFSSGAITESSSRSGGSGEAIRHPGRSSHCHIVHADCGKTAGGAEAARRGSARGLARVQECGTRLLTGRASIWAGGATWGETHLRRILR